MAVCEVCECYVDGTNRAWWMATTWCISCAPPEDE